MNHADYFIIFNINDDGRFIVNKFFF